MTNKKSVNPVRNDAWFTEGTQGDVGGDSPPVVVNTSQSSSKLLPGAENNSKRNGHANPDDTKVHNDENIDDKCNHDNAVIHDCCSDKVGLEEGNLSDVLPIPPDGGYGWVIVFAAFMSNFVVDGIANSFGAFMSIYQDYFNASKALVSLIGSLLIGCYLLIGPIVGGLVNKYGARMVVIIGSFVAGLSFLASLFCSNIYMFMIFYGILGGAGFGLIYLPSIVTVGYYFEKKRSIATGLAVAGSGVGTFVLPPLCIVLINQFGWKIAVCSLSALSFSSIIYGLLYRPLQTSATRRKEENTKADVEELLLISKEKEWKPSREDNEDSAANENKHQKFTRIRNSQSECEMHEFDEMTPLSPTAGNMTGKNRDTLSNSSEELSTRARRDPTTSMKSKTASTDLKTSHGNLAKVLSKISVHSFTHSTSFRSRSSQMKDAQSLASITSNIDRKEFNKPLNRRDIFYSGSIRNLPEFKSEGGNYRSYRESQISIPTSAVVQAVADLSQVEGTSDMHHKFGRNGGTVGEQSEQLNELVDCYVDRRCKWIPVTIRNILNEMIDISLLKEPTMFLLCISNLFGMLGFYVPFMFLIDMAVAKGHSKGSGSILLSVIGVTNTIGRIAFGWLADRGWLSALAINNFALLGCGVLTCLCPLLPGYGGLMVYSILFGFIISAYISLTSIVLVDELGLDRLTNSFGLLVVSRGIASLLGTPLAGVVYDVFASYDASFYFAGVIILLSGLVSCLIPAVRRCRHNESAKETVEEARMIDEDIQSEKLSVLTEHTEENLTEHQRTVQSLRQKQKFLERRTND